MNNRMRSVVTRRMARFAVAAWLLLSVGVSTAAPLRVLPPDRWAATSSGATCIAELINERLGECEGVDIVGGDRARQVISHYGSGAYELTDAQRWSRLRNHIDIDAMIVIAESAADSAAKADSAFEIRIYRGEGVTTVKAALGGADADPPRAASAILGRVARELGLGEADARRLAEIRVDDAALFTSYYASRIGKARWPVNPYVSAVISLATMRSAKQQWVADAIAVRVAADYINAAMYGRQSDKLKEAQLHVRPALLRLLGTEHEREADPLMRLERQPLSEPLMGDIEQVLLQIAQPLVGEASAPQKIVAVKSVKKAPPRDAAPELDDLDDAVKSDKRDMAPALDKPTQLGVLAGQTNYSHEQRIGAMRLLGVMASPRAAALLASAAGSSDAKLREIAASGLGNCKGDVGIDELTALAADSNEQVVYVAARSLSQRGRPPADMRRRASAMLDKPEPYRAWAALWLAADAANGDETLNTRLASDPSPAVRSALHKALAAKAAGSSEQLARVMRDADAASIVAAIRGLPRASIAPGNETFNRLVRLANDPSTDIAAQAREALAPHRPNEPRARAGFDFAVATPYVRQRTVASLRQNKEPWARAELAAACANDDAHTRVDALAALAGIDPAAARPLALAALGDAHRFVRFNAAAILPAIADASMTQALGDAIPRQSDRATSLYLADALAKIGGGPPPPPQPRANGFNGPETIVTLFGSGGTEPDSPYPFCFKPSHGNHVRDDTIHDNVKRAHERGVVFAYNIGPLPEPGVALVDGVTQDSFWIYLDDQLDTPSLPFIDMIDPGVGGIAPDALWQPGWRYFCEEESLDAARVNGDKSKLTAAEAVAWRAWATRRCVEARNRFHDYFKLKFGRLHPGILFAANVAGVADSAATDWKFDVSFVRGGSRPDARQETYSAIRRNKTLWPDRLVFWVCEGYELPDLWVIKHDSKLPTEPLTGRGYRAYADAIAAWAAGANPGWAGMIVLRTVNWGGENDYSGFVLGPEDIKPDGVKVRAAIDYAFKGAESIVRDKADREKAHRKEPGLGASEKDAKIDALVDVIDKPDPDAGVAQQLARDKDRMFMGIKYLGKHLLDITRLFASLPRANPAPDALVVSASSEGNAREDLLEAFDVAPGLSHLERMDLRRYRMIVVSDAGLLTSAATERLRRWLKETPGVLYVHAELTADASRNVAPPWGSDVVSVAAPSHAKRTKTEITSPAGESVSLSGANVVRSFKVGGAAKALRLVDGEPVLAAWKHAEFKGAMVFDGIGDGGQPYREVVRAALTELHRSHGVGVALEGPGLRVTLTDPRWIASTTSGNAPRTELRGADLLTGAINPAIGPDRRGAVVGRDFQGRYAAAYNGVSVLCESPIRKVEKIPGGLQIECDGLIQAASDTGKAELVVPGGPAPSPVPSEKARRWIYAETTEGVATQPVVESGGPTANVLFVRCNRPLQILAK